MQMNQYLAYSVISTTENKNSMELEKVFLLVENFSKIDTYKQAKNFLEQTYQINAPMQHFAIGRNSFLDISENQKKYSIKIYYINNDEKECVIYNYRKNLQGENNA